MSWYNLRTSAIWILLTFIISLSGCQTIHENNEEEKKKAEILSTQKSVIAVFNKGLPAMALKELRRLMVMHPEDPDFINLMGLTQLALENPRKAARYFQKSYKLFPVPRWP